MDAIPFDGLTCHTKMHYFVWQRAAARRISITDPLKKLSFVLIDLKYAIDLCLCFAL